MPVSGLKPQQVFQVSRGEMEPVGTALDGERSLRTPVSLQDPFPEVGAVLGKQRSSLWGAGDELPFVKAEGVSQQAAQVADEDRTLVKIRLPGGFLAHLPDGFREDSALLLREVQGFRGIVAKNEQVSRGFS